MRGSKIICRWNDEKYFSTLGLVSKMAIIPAIISFAYREIDNPVTKNVNTSTPNIQRRKITIAQSRPLSMNMPENNITGTPTKAWANWKENGT